jgi:transketolase
MTDLVKHRRMANAIRALAMDAVEKAKSGHPGLPMGAADIATVLFTRFLKFDPTEPHWPDRDRFVLSAGHGSMLLYSVLFLLGVEGMTIDEIKRFRQLDSKTPGHPENFHTIGIETTTGPLGQGLANSVGMAITERLLATEFGDEIVDHRTYALVSDGDLMEGISHEAISIAGHLCLSKLTVLYDDNHISIDGPTSLSDSTDPIGRFEAAGWDASRIDGQNPDDIIAALEAAQENDKPTLIACRTTIGYGAPTKAGTNAAHGSPLGPEEIAGARKNLGWEYPPFDIPADVRDSWRIVGLKASQLRKDWEKRLAGTEAEKRAEFERRIRGDLPAGFEAAMLAYKKKLSVDRPKTATRKSSEMALDVINAVVPETIGGSADLTGSNNTRSPGMKDVAPGDFSGRYIHWGIRELGMSGALNGMALHRGIIPYSGTFLIFSDYARPAIRLAALMGNRIVWVLTHDSIGLGEDGPTHQPVEQLAALRAIPNLLVFRPADAVETAECWQLALERRTSPSLLALTRQDLPTLRTAYDETNICARGAYELSPADGDAEVSLFASGSEVEIAVDAKALIEQAGHRARVVTVPCFELFDEQSEDYQAEIIGTTPVNVAIEAAVRQGWDRFIGRKGIFIGMHSFGASAPYKELYAKFGITAEAAAKAVLDRLAALA